VKLKKNKSKPSKLKKIMKRPILWIIKLHNKKGKSIVKIFRLRNRGISLEAWNFRRLIRCMNLDSLWKIVLKELNI